MRATSSSLTKLASEASAFKAAVLAASLASSMLTLSPTRISGSPQLLFGKINKAAAVVEAGETVTNGEIAKLFPQFNGFSNVPQGNEERLLPFPLGLHRMHFRYTALAAFSADIEFSSFPYYDRETARRPNKRYSTAAEESLRRTVEEFYNPLLVHH